MAVTERPEMRPCKTNTPWGQAQWARTWAPGIISYSTASHGGFHLSRTRLAEMPAKYRRENIETFWYAPDGWYEEDCEWCVVILSFPEFFPPDEVEEAQNTFERWYAAKVKTSLEVA